MTDASASSHADRPAKIPDLVVPHAVTPFHLAQAPVRGRLITLGPLANAILTRHPKLPNSVKRIGGEGLALVAAMSTALKFEGSFSLQIKGDGPISLFLADCTHDGALRFTAQITEEPPHPFPNTTPELLGKGYLAFTVDQGAQTDRYQGIVGIEGETLSEMATHYFQTSEQHDCSIHLFARQNNGVWHAGALVLERLPGDNTHAENDDHPRTTEASNDLWETACAFASTLKEDEIFNPNLSSASLISRLFGTLDVSISPSRALSFGCRCNKARLQKVLARFSDNDLDHMAKDDVISMDCNFCNVTFDFQRSSLPKETGD